MPPLPVTTAWRPARLAASLLLLGACAPGLRPETAPVPTVARPDVAAATPNDLPAPSVRAPAVDAPAAVRRVHQPHLDGATFDLDVHAFEDEERVQHYVRLFTGGARATFTGWLSRGSRYDAMIRAKLRGAKLPEDLRFLPLVESGYEPNAVSRASAVGMWQFMAPTARELGLRVDWWVDERRDPVKSTDAAVRMLRWLRGQYGSHFVAAAAYNGGPTRISRGLATLAAAADTTAGEARFFALAQADQLRPETKNYVPQLIAATLVGNELARYDLTVREQRAFAYDSAFVEPLLPLAAVARATGATRAELLDLNPQLLRGLTPPGGRTLVRLPSGSGGAFASRLARLDASTRRAFRRATTKKRDQWEAIAERERVPLAWLTAFNPSLETAKSGKWKGRIIGGQPLRVPTAAVLEYGRTPAEGGDDGPGELPALAAAPAEEPARDRKDAKRRAPAADEKSEQSDRVAKPEPKLADARAADAREGKAGTAEKHDASDRSSTSERNPERKPEPKRETKLAGRSEPTDEKPAAKAESTESRGRVELLSLATVASPKKSLKSSAPSNPSKPDAAPKPTKASKSAKGAKPAAESRKPAANVSKALEPTKSAKSAKSSKAVKPAKATKATAPAPSARPAKTKRAAEKSAARPENAVPAKKAQSSKPRPR